MTLCNTRHELRILCCAVTCTLLLGCDVPGKQIGQLDSESGEETEETDDTTDTESDSETTAETEEEPLPASCQLGIENLSSLYQGQWPDLRCAMILRSDYETGEILGWQIRCRGADEPELSAADALALTSSGGENISNDGRNYVFYSDPLGEGGLAVVGERSGLVFDGSIEIGGEGVITQPGELLDPNFLGSGCAGAGAEFGIELWLYDLTGTEDPDSIDQAFDQALTQVWDTALFYNLQGVEAAAMLAYPRTLDPFVPASAEIITILDRGAVE